MALNIKNQAVERLAAEVAGLAGESKTEAIRKALEERRDRLKLRTTVNKEERVLKFLRQELWPAVHEARRAHPSDASDDEILGYGPLGI